MSPDPSSHVAPGAFDPREQAERCRRLARTVTDERALKALAAMASEYDEKARKTGTA